MIYAITILGVAFFAWLAFDSHQQRESTAAILAQLASLTRAVAPKPPEIPPSPDLTALIALVENLCQRIQAPDMAAAVHATQGQPLEAPPAVSIFDDSDHWESKEEMAARLAAQERLAANGVTVPPLPSDADV